VMYGDALQSVVIKEKEMSITEAHLNSLGVDDPMITYVMTLRKL